VSPCSSSTNEADGSYSFKIKVDAADPSSAKHKMLQHQGINYLYRCESDLLLPPGCRFSCKLGQ
jgi:hypothetical protein